MSLLLDALKKAAEEKQQTNDQPVLEKIQPEVPTGDTNTGSQMRSLLQGKTDEDGASGDSIGGLESFGEQGDRKQPELSLSLLDDDHESIEKDGSAVDESVAKVAPVVFDLELLDDDEVDLEPAASTSPPPSTALSSLTLVDDDIEVDQFSVAVSGEIAESAGASEVSPHSVPPLDELEMSSDQQVATDVLKSSVAPGREEAQEPELPEAELHPAPAPEAERASDFSSPEPEPGVSSEPVAVKLEQKSEVEPDSDTGVSVEPNSPVSEASAEAVPVAPAAGAPVQLDTGKATEGDSMESLARQMGIKPGQNVYEPSPDRVLDALKRSKRRRRVLLLALAVSVGLTAGGWGFLVYEEAMQQNDQLLRRYQPQVRKPVAPVVPPETAAVAGVERSPEPRTVVEQISTTTDTVEVVEKTQTPKAAVETALQEDIDQNKERRIEAQGGQNSATLLKSGPSAIVAPESDERITIKKKTVTQGILESGRTLDIVSKESEARVMSAYRAFKSGDLQLSQRLYSQALEEDPFSRDAVMGLAAIAASQRDYARASYYYRQLLDYDPADTAAFEGLIGLPDTGLDLVDIESRLRNYLARNPDSERAHARLGRTMARQKRWAEAQSAFFNAHRLNPESAAHALNVAIALDHLRKYRAAQGYYEKVLTLSARPGTAPTLNISSVRQRLDALSKLEVQ